MSRYERERSRSPDRRDERGGGDDRRGDRGDDRRDRGGGGGYDDRRGGSGYDDRRGSSGYDNRRGSSGYDDRRGGSGYDDRDRDSSHRGGGGYEAGRGGGSVHHDHRGGDERGKSALQQLAERESVLSKNAPQGRSYQQAQAAYSALSEVGSTILPSIQPRAGAAPGADVSASDDWKCPSCNNWNWGKRKVPIRGDARPAALPPPSP